jgi:hypothetical protein
VKEIKRIQTGSKSLSLFADDRIPQDSSPPSPKKTLLDVINTFGKVARYKINIKSKYLFYISILNRLRKKSGKRSNSQYP